MIANASTVEIGVDAGHDYVGGFLDRELPNLRPGLLLDVREAAPAVEARLAPPAGGFVGRERELAQLEAALHDACAGQGRLVLVSGEPGIGKTRLTSELARVAAEV